jgi:hypothetical protein
LAAGLVHRSSDEIGELVEKANELAMTYQSKKNEQWENYQRSLSGLTKNATLYLGDLLFFLVGWIALFRMFPHSAWVHINGPRFWPVSFTLLCLAWFAWFQQQQVERKKKEEEQREGRRKYEEMRRAEHDRIEVR